MTRRQPSFRGVPFQQQSGELRSGRRGQQYEYPNRERGGFLDLGKKIDKIDVRGFYSGDQSLDDWKILRNALDNHRPGELITYMGDRILKAHCIEYSYSHSVTRGLNITYFNLKFIDADNINNPKVTGNVRGLLQTATTNTEAAVQTNLLDKLFANIPEHQIPQWAKDILTGDYQNYFDEYIQAYNEVAGLVDTIGIRLTEFGFFEATKTRNNNITSTSARRLMQDIQQSPMQRQSLLNNNNQINKAIIDNQNIVYTAGDVMGLNGAANIILSDLPTSKESAESYRQEYNKATNYLLLSITDSELYALLRTQQTAVNQFIGQELIKLPEERQYKGAIALPAIVIANQLTGDDKRNIVPLQEQILSRNGIKDPLNVKEATWLR